MSASWCACQRQRNAGRGVLRGSRETGTDARRLRAFVDLVGWIRQDAYYECRRFLRSGRRLSHTYISYRHAGHGAERVIARRPNRACAAKRNDAGCHRPEHGCIRSSEQPSGSASGSGPACRVGLGRMAGHDVEHAQVPLQMLVRLAPVSGDHSQQLAAARKQRGGLCRPDAGIA